MIARVALDRTPSGGGKLRPGRAACLEHRELRLGLEQTVRAAARTRPHQIGRSAGFLDVEDFLVRRRMPPRSSRSLNRSVPGGCGEGDRGYVLGVVSSRFAGVELTAEHGPQCRGHHLVGDIAGVEHCGLLLISSGSERTLLAYISIMPFGDHMDA
jgi:hypothetical protein